MLCHLTRTLRIDVKCCVDNAAAAAAAAAADDDNDVYIGWWCRNVIKSFYTAGMLMDVLTTFGQISEDVSWVTWFFLYQTWQLIHRYRATPCNAMHSIAKSFLFICLKQYEIGCQSVLTTNRMSHMGFQLVRTMVALNDLQWRNSFYFALFHWI